MHCNYFYGIFYFVTLLMVTCSKRSFYNFRNQMTVSSIRCIELDRSFARFAYCHLKPINRTTKLLNLRVLLLQPPVTKSKAQLVVWKRANGYKPFIINVTINTCDYLGGKTTTMVNWFFDIWRDYTNINHSCPYVSDMIVDNLPLINKVKLPSVFPGGDYRIDLKVDAFDIWRALVEIFITLTD